MRSLEELQAIVKERHGTHLWSLTKGFSDEEFVLYQTEDIQKTRWTPETNCYLCHQPIHDYKKMLVRHGVRYHPQCFVNRVNQDGNRRRDPYDNYYKDYFEHHTLKDKNYFDKIFRLVFKIDPPVRRH
jgi:hypothetical protein